MSGVCNLELTISLHGSEYAPVTSEAGFNYRILVVDDDPNVLRTSVLVLEHKGYEVRAAQDGFEALTEPRRSVLYVIICDLGMPNMSGFELLSVVRRRFPHIPVIAISGEYEGSPGVIA